MERYIKLHKFEKMIKLFRVFKKKQQAEHTFKGGVAIYKVRDEDMAKVPAKKILDIQEHINYIALLGVDKHRYRAYLDKVVELCKEAIDGKKSSLADIISLTDNVRMGMLEHQDKIAEINIMMFDAFFYLDGEDYTKVDVDAYIKKKNLLNSDPISAAFFFQKHKSIFTNYGIILNGAIQVAALQAALVSEIKAQIFSNTSEGNQSTTTN